MVYLFNENIIMNTLCSSEILSKACKVLLICVRPAKGLCKIHVLGQITETWLICLAIKRFFFQ